MKFEECEIKKPEAHDLDELYHFLGDIFPSDQPLISQLLREEGNALPHWRPYSLYRGTEILGSVSLFSFDVWYEGEELPIEGVGWVATAPEFRRQGVARYLMNHALEVVDHEKKFSVLFTTIPGAYRGHGFKEVPQFYFDTGTEELSFPGEEAGSIQLHRELSIEQVDQAAGLHSSSCPVYEGKVIRREGNWAMYRMLFNPYPEPHIGFLEKDGKVEGYIRVDLEPDRILISELCLPPSDEEGTAALLRCAADFAAHENRDRASFALPPDHFVWEILRKRGVNLREEEGQEAVREIFMVRPPGGGELGPLSKLQWSLADKF